MGEKGQASGGAPAGGAADASQVDPSLVDTTPGLGAGQVGSTEEAAEIASKVAGHVGSILTKELTGDKASQLGATASIAGAAGSAGAASSTTPAASGEKGQSTSGTLGEMEGLQGSVQRQTKSQEQLSNLMKKQSDTDSAIESNIK